MREDWRSLFRHMRTAGRYAKDCTISALAIAGAHRAVEYGDDPDFVIVHMESAAHIATANRPKTLPEQRSIELRDKRNYRDLNKSNRELQRMRLVMSLANPIRLSLPG